MRLNELITDPSNKDLINKILGEVVSDPISINIIGTDPDKSARDFIYFNIMYLVNKKEHGESESSVTQMNFNKQFIDAYGLDNAKQLMSVIKSKFDAQG